MADIKIQRRERMAVLKALRPGTTLQEIADFCGVSAQAVNKWFNGGALEDENLSKLAEFFSDFGATSGWIKFGEGDPPLLSTYGDKSLAKNFAAYEPISHYDVAASAGNGYIAIDHADLRDEILFKRTWLHKNGWKAASLTVINVDGDSMEPQIQDGGVVLVNTDERQVRDGRIYAYVDSDHIRIKQFFLRTAGGAILHSINQQYGDENISPEQINNLNIIGRAIWTAGTL